MKLQLQVLDCDYKMLRGVPLIRIYGKTESGEAVAVFYDKFLPYFYAQVAEEKQEDFKNEIRERYGATTEDVERFLAVGYGPKVKLLKITCKDPGNVKEMRELAARYGTPYEADILFRQRFMVDFGIKGMCWIEAEGDLERTEIVSCKTLVAETIRPVENQKNVPLKCVAIDIETLMDGDRVAEAGKDEVIMISLAFKPSWNGKDRAIILSKSHKGENVIGTNGEMEMFKKFSEVIADYDPDIITGYNINAFDMPFITERMRTYGLSPQLGRSEKPVLIKKMQNSMMVSITGRVVADTFEVIKRDPWMKFKRYDLRTVAKELLKSEKLDVGGPAEIKAHWLAGGEKLDKLIAYCMRDSELALRLVTEKGLLDKFYELAKVSGLLLQDAFGGQSQRHECKLLHVFRPRDIVMPCKPEGGEMRHRNAEREKVGLKGAVVLEPVVGLHTGGAVLVLDFASLYPSIIRSFNICPTTCVLRDSQTDAKFHTAPNGARFVEKEVREGVLPAVVKELIETRTAVKKQMKAETDTEIKRQLNAKQLALKDMANSLYGYTGYVRSRLYLMDVAGAITSYGRENIARTKELVEKNFDVKVLYGDTDSIFMKTDIADLDRAQQKGEEISAYVTERLPGLKFAFEKIFKTFLILSKKRYAGWKFEKTVDGWKDKMEMKGIETVRRDWCDLTTESMSEVLRIILKEQDAKKAIQYTRSVVKDLSEGRVPMEKLAVVKGVTRGLDAYKGMQPHVELAKKLMSRDATRGSMVGERLSYIIIKGNAMLSMRAEDPAYAKEKGLEIDSQYYVENQLLPPLERIFEALGVSRTEVLEGVRQKSLSEMFGGKKTNPPELTTLDSWEKIACGKCDWTSATPSLSGVCPKCGGQIFFSKGGELGKFVKG